MENQDLSGYDEAVGADEAEHASPNLEAVGSVVGVDDQGFDTLLAGEVEL